MSSAADPRSVAGALIHWHAEHGRHDLPWQRLPTPYRVWVSEVMLQQTQVATVLGYFERFVERLPSVAALAAASLDEVLHLWSGLGYYSRARNLQRAAQQLVAEHGGQLPDELEQLARLPGIGRSTAAAIVALAHGRRATILDGNVKRVLARLFGIAGSLAERTTEQQLWHWAEQCTPEREPGIYTQAIMDLGATVCTRRRPLCDLCPLSAQCVARLSNRVQELPAPRLRATRRTRQIVMLLAVRDDGSVLLQRRAAHGVWAGLWSPPEFLDAQTAESYCRSTLGAADSKLHPLAPLRHAFTHFDLHIQPLRVQCADDRGGVMEATQTLWYNVRQPARIGLPAPIAALLSSLAIESLGLAGESGQPIP